MADYDVGYGKPPIEGRFPKGQSGNPKGPRKATAPEKGADIARRVGEEVFTINGIKYTGTEMVMRTMRNKAIKGDNVAAKAFLAFQREMGLLTKTPQNGGGVLVVPGTSEVAAWKAAAKAQQAKFRGEDPEGLAELERQAGFDPNSKSPS